MLPSGVYVKHCLLELSQAKAAAAHTLTIKRMFFCFCSLLKTKLSNPCLYVQRTLNYCFHLLIQTHESQLSQDSHSEDLPFFLPSFPSCIQANCRTDAKSDGRSLFSFSLVNLNWPYYYKKDLLLLHYNYRFNYIF